MTAWAAASSFDVTSPIDFQEVDNALNQARKEVGPALRLQGREGGHRAESTEKTLTLVADDEFKMNALWEIVQTRLVRRAVPLKNFKVGDSEAAAGGTVRRVIPIQEGIPIEAAREIVKFLKDQKLKKVQAAIQGDQVRVTLAVEGRPPGSHPTRCASTTSVSRCSSATTGRGLAFQLSAPSRQPSYLFGFFSSHTTPVALSGSSFRITFDSRSVFFSSGSFTS